jgi:hypothetical protein
LRVTTVELRSTVTVGALVWGHRPAVSQPPPFSADPASARLGQALAARVSEVARSTAAAAVAAGLIELTSPRFAKQIRDVHTLTSRAIARFLITGQGTTETERNFISRVGMFAACYGLSLATLSRTYVVWRDANLRVVNEEIRRLGVGHKVSSMARKIIRSSADTGLRRMARAYEYQVHLAAPAEHALEVPARR